MADETITQSDPRIELERARIDADVRKVEARAKVRQVIFGTMIVGVATAAFPFAQKWAELVFTERIEMAQLGVEEKRAEQEDERARREFLNSLADEARSQNIETRVILAEFFAHMAVQDAERDQWRAFLEFLNQRREGLEEERRQLTEIVIEPTTTANELAAAAAKLESIDRFETPDVRQQAPRFSAFDTLMSAVVGEPQPLSDSRVQEALRLVLEGSRADLPFAQRLLAEAGYTNGFTLQVHAFALGSDELKTIESRLSRLRVKLQAAASR